MIRMIWQADRYTCLRSVEGSHSAAFNPTLNVAVRLCVTNQVKIKKPFSSKKNVLALPSEEWNTLLLLLLLLLPTSSNLLSSLSDIGLSSLSAKLDVLTRGEEKEREAENPPLSPIQKHGFREGATENV